MKTRKFNYFYYNTPITAKQFNDAVPENWKDELNDFGCYSHGGYRATENDYETDE
jgi:hypothetical protein